MTPFIKQGKVHLGPGIPVVGNGRLTSPDDMVALIRAGVLDIIGAARPSIADPFLPTKISEGRLRGHPRVHRLQHLRLEVPAGRPDHVHPERDHRRGIPARLAPGEIHADQRAPAACSSSAAAPPAWSARAFWASAATPCTCGRPRASSAATGSPSSTLPRLNEWSRVITYRQTQLAQAQEERRGAPRRRPHERRSRCCNYGADRVVHRHRLPLGRRRPRRQLRARSRAPTPRCPHVLTPTQVMQGKPVPGKRVLILDGDGHFMGIALAELMANQGKEVTYVCDASDVAEYGTFTMEFGQQQAHAVREGHQDLLQPLGRSHRARQACASPTCTSSVPTSSGPSGGQRAAQGQRRRVRPGDRRRDSRHLAPLRGPRCGAS